LNFSFNHHFAPQTSSRRQHAPTTPTPPVLASRFDPVGRHDSRLARLGTSRKSRQPSVGSDLPFGVDRRFNHPLPVLICHRLILSRLFRSLLHQVLANLVGVADRFFDAEAFPAAIAILEPWWCSANLATLFNDRLGHHLNDRLWRLLLSSVDLSEVFDPGQIPLGSPRDFLRVPKQD
jgi:hypothetical protein